MKRLTILLFLLLAAGTTLRGQEREKNLLSIRGGLTVAHLRATLDNLSGITATARVTI